MRDDELWKGQTGPTRGALKRQQPSQTVARWLGAAFVLLGLTELFQIPLGAYQHEMVVAAMCSFCLVHSAFEYGAASSVLFFFLVFFWVALAEGTMFFPEVVFGASYVFTEHCTLGPHVLFGRPLFLPVAWFVCAYPALCLASTLLPSRSVWPRVMLAALLTMFADVVADPILSSGGSASWIHGSLWRPEWVWQSDTLWKFEGVPVSNFVGWFAVSLLYFGTFALVRGADVTRKMKDPWPVFLVNACISFFYMVCG
jgi:uncharacterized membrane protein